MNYELSPLFVHILLFRHETEAQRKDSENGSQNCRSAILKEVISSYEELSSREVIFIHNFPLLPKVKSNILEFSHLINLNHKTAVNLPENWKSAKNWTNLMPAFL